MLYYVYIIQSKKDASNYKGFCQDPYKRLVQHYNGESEYTREKGPWELVCLLVFESKTEALSKEKKLKKYLTASLLALIQSAQNVLLNP
jgi:putative endonuclease